MTKTRIIGDIHGALYEYEYIIEDCKKSIQIGDFGIGFAGPYWHEQVNALHTKGNHRFIRGNHDNPDKCRKDMVGYIEDGTIENDVMFIGGAWSIDWQWRTEGVSIWYNEELTYEEFAKLLEVYAVMKPRVMITHDCPLSIAQKEFIDTGKGMSDRALVKTRTGQALQAMFELHQPEEWYYGHWHDTTTITDNGTKFQCLGINDYIDVQL